MCNQTCPSPVRPNTSLPGLRESVIRSQACFSRPRPQQQARCFATSILGNNATHKFFSELPGVVRCVCFSKQQKDRRDPSRVSRTRNGHRLGWNHQTAYKHFSQCSPTPHHPRNFRPIYCGRDSNTPGVKATHRGHMPNHSSFICPTERHKVNATLPPPSRKCNCHETTPPPGATSCNTPTQGPLMVTDSSTLPGVQAPSPRRSVLTLLTRRIVNFLRNAAWCSDAQHSGSSRIPFLTAG